MVTNLPSVCSDRSDVFRECPDVKMDEMKPFSVPPWMVEKMKRAMEAQRDQET